ncbi:hypothetical protein MMC20_002155 [Loxospora ochrophaea]|nr:hypothetical protein [Loxospora ochrophaea]
MQPALAPAPHPLPPHGQSFRNLETSASPRDHNIDPAIAGSGMLNTSGGESGGDDNGSDGKKGGKRELSTSKRAAQNRAAQRAFRQRKEGYIKKLEEQVRDYNLLNENYKAVQAENYQLRDYIINLQSRLLESQGEFPQPPSNINIELLNPRSSESGQPNPPAPTAPMGNPAMIQLHASAARAVVADQNGKRVHEDGGFHANSIPPARIKSGTDTDMHDNTDPQLSTPSAAAA